LVGGEQDAPFPAAMARWHATDGLGRVTMGAFPTFKDLWRGASEETVSVYEAVSNQQVVCYVDRNYALRDCIGMAPTQTGRLSLAYLFNRYVGASAAPRVGPDITNRDDWVGHYISFRFLPR
jgi:hypothetical protein